MEANTKSLIWKMIFLFKVVIFRFHVSFLGNSEGVRWDSHGGMFSLCEISQPQGVYTKMGGKMS